MENASKAMIMAGAILISIMIISLAVLIFNKESEETNEIVVGEIDQQNIATFNSKITPYVGNSVAGSQVNSLLSYCISSNMATEQNEDYKFITVTYEGTTIINKDSTSYTKLETGEKYYTVSVKYNSQGYITTINIAKNSSTTV